MKYIAIAVLVALTAAFAPSLQDPKPVRVPDLGPQIFYAVLEGLYEDGVQNDVVDRVLKVTDEEYEHFVTGCPTCMYVLEAFRHYRARPDFRSFKAVSNTWGAGLDKGIRARFFHATHKVRLDVLHQMVSEWIDARMDRLRLTEAERNAWEKELRMRAKKGTMMLQQMQEDGHMKAWGDSGCPSCDGAVAGADNAGMMRGR